MFPHETCPVDGVVVEGHGTMDESYLTGEPYLLAKAPGSAVLSGAVNGDTALTVRAEQLAADSRYAKIMRVMRESEQRRPRLRRLGDQLGACYTPVAVAIALAAWAASGDPVRFLAVLVVATPCPLLIAIPVAIIGAVSLAARRGIIIKDPAVLEMIDSCRTAIFDKTGTLTYGRPALDGVAPRSTGSTRDEVLRWSPAWSGTRGTRWPGRSWTRPGPNGCRCWKPSDVSEPPGQGLAGTVGGQVDPGDRADETGRRATGRGSATCPPTAGGLECVVLVDGRYGRRRSGSATGPRADGRPFIRHLGRRHGFDRVMLVSGDREIGGALPGRGVGITEVHAGPDARAEAGDRPAGDGGGPNTVFVGDGINDAPALTAATVGIAFGQNSDVTAEAAGAVILDSSPARGWTSSCTSAAGCASIALQSAVGGMALSLVGMVLAASGYLPPVAGAIAQEVIDVAAVLNALRAAFPPRTLTDY